MEIEKYDHRKVEKKWQQFWEQEGIFKVKLSRKPKLYVLDMFPYPSGEGLHVGHPRGYVGSDVLAHYYRMNGYQVLHPIGFDAFGLPAENAAIKAGVHPAKHTAQNVVRFSKQLKILGLSYDWSRVINTAAPDYYRWTQWLFSLLYREGLAYQRKAYVNWCPKDQTVLANEQVVNGCCERCGAEVVQRQRKQWFFKITEFADDLLGGLDKLDWPESTKELQRNWIGRSEGVDLEFEISGQRSAVSGQKIKVFTTRADTLFGATYLVLAPEHPAVDKVTTSAQAKAVAEYVKRAAGKTELERVADTKSKTGVFTGAYAVNPATKEKIPVWVADYVLGGYGYGAIMAVPAHDERDFAFAKSYRLPIVEVIESDQEELPYVGHGKLINSSRFNGKLSQTAGDEIAREFGGKVTTQYRLRDWLISRQRYWGAPIPVLYDKDERPMLVDDQDLPVELPDDVEFKPTGESPLVGSQKFSKISSKYRRRGAVRREFDTMDTFVCSSWYFLRYADPGNGRTFTSKQALNYWLPVDIYVGGVEHATGHLLYARFITKVLHRLGLINFNEPFKVLRHQGLILGEDNEKMSKSRGNVVNPDEVVEGFGADALRMYEMFMGPFDQSLPWSTAGMAGVRRFLNRLWSLRPQRKAPETDRAIHKLIKKVTEDIEQLRFNTVVSSSMEFVNLALARGVTKPTLKTLVVLLAPMVPHLAEELHQQLGGHRSVFTSRWPQFNQDLIVDEMITLAVQVDGKLRGTIEVSPRASQAEVEKLAKISPQVASYLAGRGEVRSHYVPGRVINFVTK